ncbi:MAG: mRNA surveillance protein pelota [Methanocalculaceae archaeon]|jgi:protein pelota|nr:mRNA surveillance protein pelota [Methanocalculaceae archaeon]
MKTSLVEPLKSDGFGEYKLMPENLDDLWHLSHLISEGNTVFAVTLRTVDGPSDKLRAEKLEKRPVRIGVKCEKVEFSPTVNRLRVLGVILFGPDVGQHHTLNIDPGYEISVVRRWQRVDLDRLERSIAASVHGVVHIAAVEDGEAELYRIRQYGPERVTTLTTGSGKTVETNSRQNLFEELLRILEKVAGPIVVAGPGFVKEDFVKFAKTKASDTAGRMLLADTRRSGCGAVQEVIGNGVLSRITEDLQLAREVQVMDEVFLRIGQNGAVAYGATEVQTAIAYGAAETVIVADTEIRGPRTAKMIETAERLGAVVVVLSTEFEPGKRLVGLGGAAALLRYTIGQ